MVGEFKYCTYIVLAMRDKIQDWELLSLNYTLQSNKYDFTGFYITHSPGLNRNMHIYRKTFRPKQS